MATIPTNHPCFNLLYPLQPQPQPQLENSLIFNRRRRRRNLSLKSRCWPLKFRFSKYPCVSLVPKASSDAHSSTHQSAASDVDARYSSMSNTDENYVPVLVRMLGLDNDPLDREQAVVALWKYSLGGNRYVDNIMQFHGCVNLIVNLLRSESSLACEAAAGLLRMISSVNAYRDIVAECGAIEETNVVLRRPTLTPEVKEQIICMLWNLTADDKYRLKIANTALLPIIVKCLDDDDMNVIEAAGGVLANLTLSSSIHGVIVEAGVIPRLAKFLTSEKEESKVIRKEAKNALLELVKDDYYKILVMEEGLVLVPLVGAAAYASFRPALYSWPSLPDGSDFRQSSKGPSRYGASELLLGLHVEDNTDKIDKAKTEAIVGRTQQQFLARIGAIENEDGSNPERRFSSRFHQTLLPWKDGIARLVLILELEDERAIAKAADSIAAASVSEHMRISFREAGAVKRLVHLLCHNNDSVRSSVLNALDRLSVSIALCETMELEGVMHPLINILNDLHTTSGVEKALSILARIWDPNRLMKLKFYSGPVNGSTKIHDSRSRCITPRFNGNEEDMIDLLDSRLASRLVDILKAAPPNLQTKAASILEIFSMIEPCKDTIMSTDIQSTLIDLFKQIVSKDVETSTEDEEADVAYLEEVGLAVSQASRLLTKLLDCQKFRETTDFNHFTSLLRHILKSTDIPLYHKEWVAACLVRLSCFVTAFDNPITTEVTLYEIIPRLVNQLETTTSTDVQEGVVVELNRIISEGVVAGATQAVGAHGGIFPLVKLLDEGSERAVEAALAILYNLSMDSDTHSAILAAGAAPILRRIILSQKPQWTRALHLLRNLPV